MIYSDVMLYFKKLSLLVISCKLFEFGGLIQTLNVANDLTLSVLVIFIHAICTILFYFKKSVLDVESMHGFLTRLSLQVYDHEN